MSLVICTQCNTSNSSSAKYCLACGYALPKPVVEEPQPEAPRVQKKLRLKGSTIVAIVGGVLFSLGIYWGSKELLNSGFVIDKQLGVVSNEINRACPIMVDSETRLDNTVVLPGKVLQYNYTLINVVASDIDTTAFKAALTPIIREQAQSNPQMEFFRKHEVTLNYYYRDSSGRYITLIAVEVEKE